MDIPRLHAVTDDRILAGGTIGSTGSSSAGSWFLETAPTVLEAGGGDLALHLRGPASPGSLLVEAARELLPVARSVGARLMINDRVDVALAVGADGVHLGRRSLSPTTARRLLGLDVPVGVSVHSLEEGVEARDEGADYLFAGTIYASSSHPDRAASGTGLLKELSEGVDRPHARLPVIAIGGMNPARVPEITAVGAYGAASISAIWDADDPAGAVREFLEAFP
ncbi:MAG: thiamine phosphate synthase [Longimicrobiales bacterium]